VKIETSGASKQPLCLVTIAPRGSSKGYWGDDKPLACPKNCQNQNGFGRRKSLIFS
jgi:hypothetical protein